MDRKRVIYGFLEFFFLIQRILYFQANETQELEELKKIKEQTEVSCNYKISRADEKVTEARRELSKLQDEMRETEEKLATAEKQSDDLKGEVAGK